MVERLRIFKSAIELNYRSAIILKTSDHIINKANLEIEAESTIINGSIIDFKKADGSTTIFSAKVFNKNQDIFWSLDCKTNGYELMNIPIQQVYENKSPEFIVQDIVDNFTANLTYASTAVSGVSITKVVANSYAIDIIREMMDLLQWQLRIDETDNVYFEPKGTVDNGKTFTDGTDIQITSWQEDSFNMFNRVKVKGPLVSIETQEVKSGTATEFSLDHKPQGTVKVTISASELKRTSPTEPYAVDSEQSKVVFTSSRTDPTFDYSFHQPIVVDGQNDDSIATYGEIYKEVEAPFIDTFPDARRYAQNLLDVFSIPLNKVKGFYSDLDWDRDVGELITISSTIRGKSDTQLVITKIEYDAAQNMTKYEFGPRDIIFYDWQREVQERIKKLEKKVQDEDEVAFTRLFRHSLKISMHLSTIWQYNSPVDSFILGHPTLGRLRSDFDFEADCSDNGEHGTWNGTGVTSGTQFSTSGYRLSTGDFNGSDHYIQCPSISSIQTVSFYVNADALNTDIIKLTGSAKISVDNSGDITTTGLTNDTIYVDGVAATRIVAGTFALVTVTMDSINATDLEIGRQASSYFNGKIDEVMVFDSKITTGNMDTIIAKDFYDSSNSFTISGLLGYWSMDNPKLGDRFNTKQHIGLVTNTETLNSDAVIV